MKYKWTKKDAARLNKALQACNYKKSIVAKFCGVKASTLYGVLNTNPRRPGPKLIKKLADFVDVSWVRREE